MTNLRDRYSSHTQAMSFVTPAVSKKQMQGFSTGEWHRHTHGAVQGLLSCMLFLKTWMLSLWGLRGLWACKTVTASTSVACLPCFCIFTIAPATELFLFLNRQTVRDLGPSHLHLCLSAVLFFTDVQSLPPKPPSVWPVSLNALSRLSSCGAVPPDVCLLFICSLLLFPQPSPEVACGPNRMEILREYSGSWAFPRSFTIVKPEPGKPQKYLQLNKCIKEQADSHEICSINPVNSEWSLHPRNQNLLKVAQKWVQNKTISPRASPGIAAVPLPQNHCVLLSECPYRHLEVATFLTELFVMVNKEQCYYIRSFPAAPMQFSGPKPYGLEHSPTDFRRMRFHEWRHLSPITNG